MDILFGILIVLGTCLFALAIIFVGDYFLNKTKTIQDSVSSFAKEIYEILPKANCGACGYANCIEFAKAVEAKKTGPTNCKLASAENKQELLRLTNTNDVSELKKVLIVCQGGYDCEQTSVYLGYKTCKAACEIEHGNLECKQGCLGFMDCRDACKFNAINLVNGRAEIDQTKCVKCEKCIGVCPKNIIKKVEPQKAVVCCSKCSDKRRICKFECIKCGLCAKKCPVKAISFDGKSNPVIDPDICTACEICVKICPNKCIKI